MKVGSFSVVLIYISRDKEPRNNGALFSVTLQKCTLLFDIQSFYKANQTAGKPRSILFNERLKKARPP